MSFDLPGVKRGSDIESLFNAIGFVVVQWGCAEQSLDLIVATIFHTFNGHSLLSHRPRMLTKKLDLLKKCFLKLSGLEPIRDEGIALISSFAAIAKKRNDLVHAAISSISAANGSFIFSKIDINEKGHSIRPIVLDESQFPHFIKDLLGLGADANKFAERLFEIMKARQRASDYSRCHR